jgi:hypothetical protein
MTDYVKANVVATAKAEEAREEARLAACRALEVARKCKGEVDPQIKAEASRLGKEAWVARKAAKEAAAEAASARRIACFKAMPATPVPEIPASARPLKPPPRKLEE